MCSNNFVRNRITTRKVHLFSRNLQGDKWMDLTTNVTTKKPKWTIVCLNVFLYLRTVQLLVKKTKEHRQVGRYKVWQTGRQTDTGKQTKSDTHSQIQADRQVGRKAGRQTGTQSDTGIQTDRQTNKQTGQTNRKASQLDYIQTGQQKGTCRRRQAADRSRQTDSQETQAPTPTSSNPNRLQTFTVEPCDMVTSL